MIDFKDVSDKIRTLALGIVQNDAKDGLIGGQIPVGRAVVVCLQMAWADAIRDELKTALDAAVAAGNTKIADSWGIAQIWMRREHTYLDDIDPICMQPGAKPQVIMVDGKESVSLEHSMASGIPLSAVYLNKVTEFMDAVDAYHAAKIAPKEEARKETVE